MTITHSNTDKYDLLHDGVYNYEMPKHEFFKKHIDLSLKIQDELHKGNKVEVLLKGNPYSEWKPCKPSDEINLDAKYRVIPLENEDNKFKSLKLKIRKVKKSRKGIPIGVSLMLIDTYGDMTTGYMMANGEFITDNKYVNNITHYAELPDWKVIA